MSDPLAYLLIFRTYGTWLHGDERGSVDRDHNGVGTPYLPSSPTRQRSEARSMRELPLILDDAMRQTVTDAFADQCRYRRWSLLECAVRTNHAHLVVESTDLPPERMMLELKGRATRWLRERGHIAADRPVWVAGPGSRRYLWKPQDIEAACLYVREGQDIPR